MKEIKKRALISLSDKSHILDLAHLLEKKGYEIISTGGTFNYLKEQGINPIEVKEITDFPEILGGRVKTLHPLLYAGILSRRDHKEDLETLHYLKVDFIDIVIIDLYPFKEKLKENSSLEKQIEFIDIGGVSLIRAAAKNFHYITIVTHKEDYEKLEKQLLDKGESTLELRQYLAIKAFKYSAQYDDLIAHYLEDKGKWKEDFPKEFMISYEKKHSLRYGENPHQKASLYTPSYPIDKKNYYKQIQGKEISFNNLRDIDATYKLLNEFSLPLCCAIKHLTPCAVSEGENLLEAYQNVYQSDPVSIFGAILGFNKNVDEPLAKLLSSIFLEVIIAPNFSKKALAILGKKKNLILIKYDPTLNKETIEYIKIHGGLILEEIDNDFTTTFNVVTQLSPSQKEIESLLFAQKVVKHAKSNAIVIAQGTKTMGISSGQTNRIWAAQEAIKRALAQSKENLVMASDAFFPFPDIIEEAHKANIKAIIQPGGSIRDNESIKKANQCKIAMLFTSMRHFKH